LNIEHPTSNIEVKRRDQRDVRDLKKFNTQHPTLNIQWPSSEGDACVAPTGVCRGAAGYI